MKNNTTSNLAIVISLPYILRPEHIEYALKPIFRLAKKYTKNIILVVDLIGLRKSSAKDHKFIQQIEQGKNDGILLKMTSIDTCSRWLAGLEYALHGLSQSADRFVLLPGDFDVSEPAALASIENLIVESLDTRQEMVVGRGILESCG